VVAAAVLQLLPLLLLLLQMLLLLHMARSGSCILMGQWQATGPLLNVNNRRLQSTLLAMLVLVMGYG